MKLVVRTPIGTRKTPAFVSRRDDGCALEVVEEAVYAPDPLVERFDAERRRFGLGLRAVASALELEVVTASNLLRGRITFADETEVERAVAKLRAFAEALD